MPRGSFLQAPAATTQALLAEFDSNGEVRRRYENLFGRSKEECREILSRLQPKSLTESHVLPVAYYSGAGRWQYHERALSKGTVVFVTPEGKPFLKEECGNPLVVTLPYPAEKAVASPLPVALPKSLEPPAVSAARGPQASPAQLVPPMDSPAVATAPSPELTLPIPSGGETSLGPADSPGIVLEPGVPANRDLPLWLLILLPILYLLGGSPTDYGFGGSPPDGPAPVGPPIGPGPGLPPAPPAPCCSGTPDVPEAPSWTLVLAGGLAIGIVVLSRKRCRPR